MEGGVEPGVVRIGLGRGICHRKASFKNPSIMLAAGLLRQCGVALFLPHGTPGTGPWPFCLAAVK